MAGNLNSIGRPLTELINLLELAANKINAQNSEAISQYLAETIKFFKEAGQIFRPLGYVITVGLQAYYLLKSIYRLGDKNNRFYHIDSVINGVVAAALISFALVSLFNPALIFVMSMASTIVGSLRDMKALGKSFAKNVALKDECRRLLTQLSATDKEHEKILLRIKIDEMDSIIKVRQYKIAQRITGVAISLVCVAAIAVALAVGPIGWTIMGVATVVGLAVKLGIYLHKRNQIDEKTIEVVDWAKARDKEEYQNTYVSFLRRLGKGPDHSEDQNHHPEDSAISVNAHVPNETSVVKLDSMTADDILEDYSRSAPAA